MTELETYKKMVSERDETIRSQNKTINDLYRRIGKRDRIFRQLLEGWQNGDKD